MKLTSHLAQSIVDKMMKQIPYNINMMNENGRIIASGDKKRINTLHIGAKKAIKTRKTCTMDKPHGTNGLPGVNTPVFFEGKVVGVIGITGDPEKVTPLGSLLKVSTELLLNQEALNKQQQEQKLELNHFLYRWIQVKDNITDHPDLLLEAKKLNIDVLYPRRAMAIQTSTNSKIPLDNEDYKINFSPKIIIVLTKFESTLNRYVNLSKKSILKIGVGNPTKSIGQSVNEALRTLQLSKIFDQGNFLFYNDINFAENVFSANAVSRSVGYSTIRSAYQKLGAYFPNALFVTSDLLALGALDFFKENKIAVPKQVSVVSFNDSELAENAEPTLTAVKVYLPLMAKRGVEMLGRLLTTKEYIPERMIIGTSISYRESSD